MISIFYDSDLVLRTELNNEDDFITKFDMINKFCDTKELILEASGECLVKIHGLFMNIPFARTKIITWEGDIAKFIIANLKNYANYLQNL